MRGFRRGGIRCDYAVAMTEKPVNPADQPVPEGVTVSEAAKRKAAEMTGEQRSDDSDVPAGEIETR